MRARPVCKCDRPVYIDGPRASLTPQCATSQLKLVHFLLVTGGIWVESGLRLVDYRGVWLKGRADYRGNRAKRSWVLSLYLANCRRYLWMSGWMAVWSGLGAYG